MAGAVSASGYVLRKPFLDLWEDHIISVLPEFRETRRILIDGLGFDPRIAETLFETWDRRHSGGWPKDERELDSYISVCAGTVRQTAVADADARKELVEWAAQRQLASLLEALIVADWAAKENAIVTSEVAAEQILFQASHIAGLASPHASRSPSELIVETAREWLRDVPWTTRGYVQDFQDYIRSRVEAIANQSS
jgi:hypothetical protein